MGRYTCNNKCSKKAIMWLLHMEQTDGVAKTHSRNELEYSLPELHHLSEDCYCAETNTFYEFFGCHWNGCVCPPFRDVITTKGDIVAARYKQTMSRL